jgi:hypothetical protein
MTAKGRTIAGGVLYGEFVSILVAIGVYRFFIPNPPPTLWDQLLWGVFVSGPWAPLGGAGVGAFLYERAQRVRFSRLVAETGGLGAVIAGAVNQLVVPIYWGLPRIRIAIFMVLAVAGLAALGSWLLKPL